MIRWEDGTTEYEGAVLYTGERNGPSDSDFYAVVWTGAELRTIEYASTRFAGGGSARADATEEVKRAVEAWFRPLFREHVQERSKLDARRVADGKRCQAIRGRKVQVGAVGYVGQVRQGKWGELCTFDGVDGRRWYSVQTRNLEVTEPERFELSAGEVDDLVQRADWRTALNFERLQGCPAGFAFVPA